MFDYCLFQGDICLDCCLTCWCYSCVLAQIRIEWDYVIRQDGHRIGFDPAADPIRSTDPLPEEYQHVHKHAPNTKTIVDVPGFDTAPFDRTRPLVELNPYPEPVGGLL